MSELILGAIILVLVMVIFVLLKIQSDLVNKLMSRDYAEYSRSKVLEEQVRKELEVIKNQNIGELERM
jgi:hypothetical protein